jgi:hypothetical protein
MQRILVNFIDLFLCYLYMYSYESYLFEVVPLGGRRLTEQTPNGLSVTASGNLTFCLITGNISQLVFDLSFMF